MNGGLGRWDWKKKFDQQVELGEGSSLFLNNPTRSVKDPSVTGSWSKWSKFRRRADEYRTCQCQSIPGFVPVIVSDGAKPEQAPILGFGCWRTSSTSLAWIYWRHFHWVSLFFPSFIGNKHMVTMERYFRSQIHFSHFFFKHK